MKAIIIQDADASNLLDLLKLEAFKAQANYQSDENKRVVEQVHSKFHYIVCRWLQEQGASVVR